MLGSVQEASSPGSSAGLFWWAVRRSCAGSYSRLSSGLVAGISGTLHADQLSLTWSYNTVEEEG